MDCKLFHGCDLLFNDTKEGTSEVSSREVYFNNNVVFDEDITFANLKYC